MSTSDLIKFTGGSQDKGIDTFNPDINGEITWDESTVNVTGGARKGVGPRYGVAPIPGQSDTETPSGTRCNGAMYSEAAAGGQGLTKRELHLGIIPLSIGTYADLETKKPHYLHLFTSNGYYDAAFGSIYESSIFKQSPNIAAGIAGASWRNESPLVRKYKTEFINIPLTSTTTDLLPFFQLVSGRKWVNTAVITVSGKDIPMKHLLGSVTAIGTLTRAPSLNLWSTSLLTLSAAGNVFLGVPSYFNTKTFKSEQRPVTIIPRGATGDSQAMLYTATIDPSTVYDSGMNYNTAAHIDLSATAAVKTGAGVTYANAKTCLYIDEAMVTNSAHTAVLIAGKKPMAMIIQPWIRQVNGSLPQWVDLTNPTPIPRASVGTYVDPDTGANVASSFATITLGASGGVTEGGALTGILDASTTYEITFSYYNKRLDYETNVGTPFKINTVADSTALNLFDTDVDDSLFEVYQTIANHIMPFEFSDKKVNSSYEEPRHMFINDYEIRFYYRPIGFMEWLPAGSFDASAFWFRGYEGKTRICANAIGGLPGGQPNGFIDYSPLPDKRYDCVLNYKGRAWWFSQDSIHFSPINDVFSYPTRNTIPVQTGKYRGGTVHVQAGETQQTARLIIWGSEQSFVARFTGSQTLASVRVSMDTTAEFPIDGSDLEIDYLSDVTAYSFRSAIVAEGDLFFWGPSGVYADDGISKPVKISQRYEPEIFSMVDTSLIEDIHTIYNKPTKEIYWFFQPKTADATYPTHALVFNTATKEFYRHKFLYYIDSAQTINIESDESPEGIAGERIIVNAREYGTSISRPFFFDHLCGGGDMGPGKEMLVKTVSTPTAGQRRLTFASGHDALTAIAVNDYVSLIDVIKYDPSLTDGDDMLAKVTAVDNAAHYIDILLPTGADFDASASPAYYEYFPVYHGGLLTAADPGIHGIPYQIKTNYWLPAGMSESWYWLYIYFLFKYSGIPTPTDIYTKLPMGARIGLQYRTLVSGDYASDTLKLKNNSDGHCQIHHPLRNVDRSANGQALRYLLSGVHIGNPWTLEYLEAHCQNENGFTLKEFEG